LSTIKSRIGIEDVVFAALQESAAQFRALADGGVGGRGAVAHRHDIVLAEEDVRLAEDDLAA
jgi:hypothetical protein